MAAGWDIVSDEPPKVTPTPASTGKSGWDVVHDEVPMFHSTDPNALENRIPDPNWESKNVPKPAPPEGIGARLVHGVKTVLDTANDAIVAPAARGLAGITASLTGEDPKVAREAAGQNWDSHNPDAAELLEQAGQAIPAFHALGAAGELGRHALKSVMGEGGDTVADTVGDLAGVAPVVAGAHGLRKGAEAPGVAPVNSDMAPLAEAPDTMLDAAGIKMAPSTRAHMTGAAQKPSAAALTAESVLGGQHHAENILANRPVINDWGATDIGLPKGTTLTPDNIAKSEKAPGLTYDKVKEALPDRVTVSPDTQTALTEATKPDVLGRALPREVRGVAANLAAEPMNASDLMDKISALRQEGYKRTQHAPGAQVDVKSAAIGDAQLDLANILEKELDGRVANNAPALSGEYQGARTMFAKINTVKRALHGYDIDPAKIAKADAKTGSLTGGLKIIADAHTHAPNDVALKVPDSASLGQGAPAAATAAGAGAIASMYGHPLTGTLLAATGLARPIARRVLRGADQSSPVPEAGANGALGSFFGRDTEGFHGSQEVPTAERMAGDLSMAPEAAAPAAPAQGGHSLADLLSGNLELDHGQQAPGLSLAPDTRAPAAGGPGAGVAPSMAPALADFLSQGLETQEHAPAARGPSNADLPGVMASRVEPAGPHIQENVQVSPINDQHVIPGSTLITKGGTRSDPDRFIALTPQPDGSMRVTQTRVKDNLQGKGYGQKNILDAIDYGAAQNVKVNGDSSVHASQLRALFSLKNKGSIDFDFRTPEIEAKARRIARDNGKGKDGDVLKDGGQSVTLNWRRAESLGSKLAKG